MIDIGIATITIALIAGAVLGRLYTGDSTSPTPIGDRVFCGLLAVPWIGVLVHKTFPYVWIGWKLLAPVPVLIYTLLLAATDWDIGWAKKHFTLILVAAIAVFYLIVGTLLFCYS